MAIQAFLTSFINTLVLSSILFLLLDLFFFLLNFWQQLNPPTQSQSADFYHQVKDLLGNDDSPLIPSTI